MEKEEIKASRLPFWRILREPSKTDLMSKIRTLVDFLTVIFVGAYTVVSYLSFRAVYEQLTVMQADQRPWIYVKASVISPLTFDNDGGKIGLRFDLDNTGHSPAFWVWPVTNMYPLTPKSNPIDEQQKRCERLRKHDPNRVSGIPIFPNKSEHIDISLNTMSRVDINHALADRPLGEKFIQPIIGGCVVYELKPGGPVHETGFIYQLLRTDASDPEKLLEIDPSIQQIPADHLKLEQDARGGSFAD